MSFAQALCVGKHELFDSTHPDDHARAARLCAACPLIDDCAERLADLRVTVGYYGHPEGTWAGQLLVDSSGRNATRRAVGDRNRARIAREDEAFDDAECRLAHAAYARGVRSDWAAVGHRVYQRRVKQWRGKQRGKQRGRGVAA